MGRELPLYNKRIRHPGECRGPGFKPVLRNMFKIWIPAFAGMTIYLLVPNPIFAGTDTGADFLKIPIGAEAAGLGQAYTAMASGINALNWNPAGILQTPSSMGRPTMGLSLSHQDQLEENKLDHLGVIVPSRAGKNSLGFDLIRLSYADQEGRDAERRPTNQLSASDMAFGAAIARNFGSFQLGTQVKLIRQELAGSKAQGLAMDLGLLSAMPNPRLTLGASVRNLGPRMKFLDDTFELPLTMSIGSAFRVTGPLTLALDVHYKPHQRQTVLSLGSQFLAGDNFTLRAGYLSKLAESVTNTQESETNRGNFANVSGLAGGLGFMFKQFSLDYSITPFGELGNTQMLTLSSWFGAAEEKKSNFESPEEEVAAVAAQPTRVILILPAANESWWGSLR